MTGITNIDIGKDYDEVLGNDDVHYQTFGKLAAFFGRDMPAHRHDGYFQLHYLVTGHITLQLDESRYSVQAPLFILTPPSVAHAFFTQEDTDGHVLTVRQDLISPLLESLYSANLDRVDIPAICLSVADKPQDIETFNHYWDLMARESANNYIGRDQVLSSLAQALFTFYCALSLLMSTMLAAFVVNIDYSNVLTSLLICIIASISLSLTMRINSASPNLA